MSIESYPSPNGVLTSLIWRKTMSGGETSLSGYDNASQALSYTPGQEQVYLNGILLVRGDDYTATNGTTITGLSALSASDFVQVNCYNNFSVASVPAQNISGTIANNQLQNSAITINGSAISLGGTVTLAGDIESVTATSPLTGGGSTGALTVGIQEASTSQRGSVQLSDSTSTTSSVLAATPTAVKSAYDLANGAIPKTLTTTTGDIIYASSANTPARLGIGSASQVLSISGGVPAWTTVASAPDFLAGKNKIINGDFNIWQRGTTFTPGLDTAVADRFKTYCEGSGTTRSLTQQTFTPGTAPVAGYEGKYFLRYAQTVGPSAAIGNNLFFQNIEDVRTFAGQTVTFSFWAKASSTTVLPTIYAYQIFGTGGSPSGNVQITFANNVSVGTSWTRYSYTAAIDSISGKTIGTNNDSFISFRTQHPLGSGNTFTVDYWGWQVEVGSTATPFTTATGTLQGELAACHRYYYQIGPGAAYASFGIGGFHPANNSFMFIVNTPVVMRTVPTFTTVGNFQTNGTGVSLTGLGFNGTYSNSASYNGQANCTGATTGYGSSIRNTDDTTAKMMFSSEL